MKLSNVDVNKVFLTITVDEMKQKLFSKANYNAWSKYTEQQQETWINTIKRIAKIKKYTPEQRYGAFVIKEFVRFAKAINKAAFLEIDRCIEIYEYDIIGDTSIVLDDFLQLSNNGMRENTEKSLALAVAINKIVAEILDEEFDALETLYYKAFLGDFQLKNDTVCSIKSDEEEKKTQYQKMDEFIKWLSGEAAEAIKKEESKKTPQTKQSIATDFINSERKTRYYK